jgi:hypothetical protein
MDKKPCTLRLIFPWNFSFNTSLAKLHSTNHQARFGLQIPFRVMRCYCMQTAKYASTEYQCLPEFVGLPVFLTQHANPEEFSARYVRNT